MAARRRRRRRKRAPGLTSFPSVFPVTVSSSPVSCPLPFAYPHSHGENENFLRIFLVVHVTEGIIPVCALPADQWTGLKSIDEEEDSSE